MGAYYTKSSASARQYVQAKARITRAQGKAKAIGLLYLVALLAVTALACLPLVTVEGLTLGVMEFWKPFTQLSEGLNGKLLVLAAAVVYGIMLLILLINVIKAFGKLNWLFKKKASRLYGFNRNMYAMDDIGNFFSSSFAAVVVCHFLIVVILKTAEAAVVLQPLAFIVLALGVLAHFACGLFAGNVSLFSTEGAIVEEKRELGNFAPFVRNLLQIVAAAAITYFFVGSNNLNATFQTLVKEGGLKELLASPMNLIMPALEFLMLVWLVGMFAYALGTTEFDMEGKEAAGRKSFLVFSILMLLTAAGAYVCGKFVLSVAVSDNVLIIAGICLVMMIEEICTLKYPVEKTEDLDEVDPGTYLTENYDAPGVYLTPVAAQAMTYGAEVAYMPETMPRRK